MIDLVLDPELGDSGLGILGYVAGAFSPEIEFVGVAACCACVRELGDEGAARALTQELLDSPFGGGEVFAVRQAGCA